MTKMIFVTGGVVSSVGKGVSVASIGRLLKDRGVSVSLLKLDPYLNVDPGTMSPYQHGEVFVTEDGGETDLDLGHYERFVDIDLTQLSNVTAGQIYSEVISKERKGEFLGGTIQAIPHVTDAIKQRIMKLAEVSNADVIVVEVGGTVGDIEGLPFLEAIRQMRRELGKDSVFYIHVTFLPYISATQELKTKPTQHSVRELRSIGILPDAIICRSDHEIDDDIKTKISIHCDVPVDAVITLPTVSSVYEVPLILEHERLGDLINSTLDLTVQDRDLAEWHNLVDLIQRPKRTLSIAVVGKYVDLHDSYISVKEALLHAGLHFDREVEVRWVGSEEIEEVGAESLLASVSGIVVPGGFGPRGVEGMIETVRYARDHEVPYLGLCLGLQVMVIDIARNLLGFPAANSTEFDPDTPHPVIDLMEIQKGVTEMGGTMRLGVYPCQVVRESWASKAYGDDVIYERHRHRWEFNNTFREEFEAVGLWPVGMSPDAKLIEIMELENHPFMVGTQFHPEFLSRPNRPHPLFREFVGVAGKTVREGGQRPLPLGATGSNAEVQA
ncbi:MAG: CTP synthetase [Chloroflexi bacterium]|jgi:CTP synthase|nr:CTP synthetase [Chloroflexota bacterium]MDP6419725.1 CTP synthase [SAR202 cluster bacterium]HAL47201.1 CTP synthase [Dehalococcoidia bacterium]MDP6663939.1 CTP synthase [SAR202 cluster bacterium]MDP6798911.1 CTP synthase [SAR202 cluster bacterium]|tara:strand:+ start:1787 stop:3448 length:1662 start_codon:yes stop_codon:yes gene_type:complete